MYKKILAAGMAAFLVFSCFGCENRKNLQVYICLASTGEEIYRSGVLEPGEREVYGKITKQLPSGDHEAAAAFVFLDPEDETAAGSVETKIVLTVE